MFIRAKDNLLKNGSKQTSYSLCESRRVKGDPKQKTILNLGKNFPIQKKDWNQVTDRVTCRLKKEPLWIFEPDVQIDAQVDRIVKELNEIGYDIFAKRDDRHLVSIEGIEDLYSMSVGGERMVLKALSDLGFDKHLKKTDLSIKQSRLAHALIAARCLAPGSELYTDRWLSDESSLYSLLHLEAHSPSLNSLYRIGEKLYDHKEMLMEGLFKQSQELLNYSKTIVFYDLTNVYYYGKAHGDLLAYGRSKEKRSDGLLVSLALVLDASGFPCQVELFPGNISEPKTLAQAIEKLGGQKPSILMDAGIATKANLDYLTEKGLKWLCIDRQKKKPPPAREPDQVYKTLLEARYRLWDITESKDIKRVQVQSAFRKKARDAYLSKKRKALEASLSKLDESIKKSSVKKRFTDIIERVGKLKRAYRGIAHQYNIEIRPDKEKRYATGVHYHKNPAYHEANDTSGTYVLSSSRMDWSMEELLKNYHQLGDIERVFRCLKSELGLRPIYHHKIKRIKAHLFLSVLAYYVVHLVRVRLKERDITYGWNRLVQELSMQRRTITKLPKNATTYILAAKDMVATEFQKEVYKAMGLEARSNLRYHVVNTEEEMS
jgi:transposase